MNTKLIIYSSGHPLTKQILQLGNSYQIVAIDSPNLLESISKSQVVFDCTCLEQEDKKSLLKNMTHQKVYTDLGVNAVSKMIREYPQICAAFSLSMFGATPKREVYIVKHKEELVEFLNLFGFSIYEHSECPEFFMLNRTIAPIINEAYYALEEELATSEDMDKAMRYGVNYPMGPFEWSQLFGKDKVYLLLTELYKQTKQERYIPCSLLS